MVRKDRLDHRPGGLNRVLTSEERAVASHGVAQQPLVGRFLSRLFFEQIKLSLVANELLPCALDASGEGDGGTGGEPESQIIGPAIVGAESAKSLCGGGFNSTRTSVAVSARYLPERRYHGTPSQRHESIKSRRAQKVSTSESFATFGSSR